MSDSPILPLTEDALNRFRITHSDRDLRPLLRRLHRLPHLTSSPSSPSSTDPENEVGFEKEMLRLELLKWRVSVERIMGSVSNLERQKAVYVKRAEETADGTERLRATLEDEKALLEGKRRERDWLVRCDEVAGRISARGSTRADLDERIAELQQSLADHRTSHELYLSTTQARIDTFAQITRLVDECRALTLPVEPHGTLPVDEEKEKEKMEVDEPSPVPTSPGGASKLSATALPFAPATTTTTERKRASTPPTMKPPASGHALPSRPSRPSNPAATSTSRIASTTTRAVSSTLPSRPSALRSVTGPAATGSLEEGELGGEEEGEVAEERERERGLKRAGTGGDREGRSTRSRK